MRSLFVAAAMLLATGLSAQQINGAGATFPNPIYSKWFSEYNKMHPDVKVNYQSIGSSGGIRQLAAGTIFFGATDGPMTNDQILAAGFRILHVPTVLGGVVPVYNIPGYGGELHFTGPVLADIFIGKITTWNDAAIRNLNPGVSLPGDPITVVHRSDGSGTSYIFCDYLSKVSPQWKQSVGVATSVNWPAGVGAKGNEGVAGLVKQTPGAIGYVELIYALQNKIAYGAVQNMAGTFVRATVEGVTAAAAAASGAAMPKDFRVSITNAPGKDAYPISSFTWLLLPEKFSDTAKRDALRGFVSWMLADGQNYAEALSYARLPQEVVAKEKKALSKIQ